MGAFADSRRRMLARRGRAATLQRPAGDADDLTVTAYLARYSPSDPQSPLQQGDATLYLTDDEISAAAWPKPGAGTFVIIDGETWAVVPGGSTPVYEGAERIGWNLWIRGGAA